MKYECSVVRPEEDDEDKDSGEDEIAGVTGGGEQKGGALRTNQMCI